MPDSEKELAYRAFLNREYFIKHAEYEKEFDFYSFVKTGDIDGVKKRMTPLGAEGSGILSKDPLRNLKYHFIVTVAMITRFCVEGGMEPEKAYSLSDLYISKADKCKSANEIHKLHKETVFDFTYKMKLISRENIYSKPVLQSMDYIYDRLHTSISVKEIADHVSLSATYFSKLFHREAGVTVSEYIAIKRVEAAQNMLRYSDHSFVDIANFLAFSSHSHFISVFKKYTGMTPAQFRKRFYRSNWEN